MSIDEHTKYDIDDFLNKLKKQYPSTKISSSCADCIQSFANTSMEYNLIVQSLYHKIPNDDGDTSKKNIFFIKYLIHEISDILEIILKIFRPFYMSDHNSANNHCTLNPVITHLCCKLNYDVNIGLDLFLVNFRNATSHADYIIQNNTFKFMVHDDYTVWSKTCLEKKYYQIHYILIELLKIYFIPYL